MPKIYMRHNDFYARIIRYDTETGQYDQLFSYELSQRETITGQYVNVGSSILGTYRSKDGPVFFVDGEQYFLADPNYTVEVKQGVTSHLLLLKYNDEIYVEAEYPRQKYIDYDPFNRSDETFLDFFLWFEDRFISNRSQFIKAYTQE